MEHEDAKVIPFPNQPDPPEPTGPDGPPPDHLPEHCWRWSEARACWMPVPHKIKQWRAHAAAAESKALEQRDTAAPPMPVVHPTEQFEDEESWLDACVVSFYQVHGVLPTPAEKGFLIDKGRWPLCEEETASWEEQGSPDRLTLILGIAAVVVGAAMALITAL